MATSTVAGGGLLAMLGRIALAAAVVNFALSKIDPKDDVGTWVDKHVPGAAWLDNLASKIGLGRSYDEQAQASGTADAGSLPPPLAKGKAAASNARPGTQEKPYKNFRSDIDALVGQGLSPSAAFGIVAGIQRESGGRADAVGDKGTAYGLAQWHPDRQADFAKWAGHDIRQSTHDEQLSFIVHELHHKKRSAGAALARAKDPADAAGIASRLYEVPAAIQREAQLRASIARNMAGLPSVGAGTMAEAYITHNTTTDNSNRSDAKSIQIGPINVTTQGGDGHRIGQDIGDAVRSRIAFQADRGLGG